MVKPLTTKWLLWMVLNQHILESIGVLGLVLAMFLLLEISFTFGSQDHIW